MFTILKTDKIQLLFLYKNYAYCPFKTIPYAGPIVLPTSTAKSSFISVKSSLLTSPLIIISVNALETYVKRCAYFSTVILSASVES